MKKSIEAEHVAKIVRALDKPLWCSAYYSNFKYGLCQPMCSECETCGRKCDGKVICEHPGWTSNPKPANINMSPWITPISELLPEIEIWTATSDNKWCLKLYYVHDVHQVRSMWQRIRQCWVALTENTPIWPSALWFQVWILRNAGIRTWHSKMVNPTSPETLYNIEKDWIALENFLSHKLEQQAAHDAKIANTTCHRAFLMCSMLAIYAGLISDHMRTWLNTPKGTFDATTEPEVLLIEKFISQMRDFDYRKPIRPVSVCKTDSWPSRLEYPCFSDRWTQMPSGHDL